MFLTCIGSSFSLNISIDSLEAFPLYDLEIKVLSKSKNNVFDLLPKKKMNLKFNLSKEKTIF